MAKKNERKRMRKGGKRRSCANGEPKFSNLEKRKLNREKNSRCRRKRERTARERENTRQVARAWGRERANAEEFKIKYCIKRKK